LRKYSARPSSSSPVGLRQIREFLIVNEENSGDRFVHAKHFVPIGVHLVEECIEEKYAIDFADLFVHCGISEVSLNDPEAGMLRFGFTDGRRQVGVDQGLPSGYDDE
jgi:hypothetical protein